MQKPPSSAKRPSAWRKRPASERFLDPERRYTLIIHNMLREFYVRPKPSRDLFMASQNGFTSVRRKQRKAFKPVSLSQKLEDRQRALQKEGFLDEFTRSSFSFEGRIWSAAVATLI